MQQTKAIQINCVDNFSLAATLYEPAEVKAVIMLAPATGMFGMGDPLPKTVAAQWRDWCNGRGYVEVELKNRNCSTAMMNWISQSFIYSYFYHYFVQQKSSV